MEIDDSTERTGGAGDLTTASTIAPVAGTSAVSLAASSRGTLGLRGSDASIAAPPRSAFGAPATDTFTSSSTFTSRAAQPQAEVLGAVASSPPQEARRVFQDWNEHGLGGRNRFVCGGRCVTGPKIDFWYNVCAWSFLLIPTVIYFVFCGNWLWLNVHPVLPILTLIVFCVTILFLLLTSCTDPGILPRRTLQQAVAGLEEEVRIACGIPPPLEGQDATEASDLEAQLGGGYKWCNSCKIIRPPRCSHCRDCDNCVMRFDHHCPFVNNCIGERNYGYFSGFLVSTGCLSFSVFAGIGLTVAHIGGEGATSSLKGPLVWILGILIGVPTVLLVLGVLVLSCFHLVLLCSGKTTKEMCGKGVRKVRPHETASADDISSMAGGGGSLLDRNSSKAGGEPSRWFGIRGQSLIHARDLVTIPLAERTDHPC